MCFDDLQNQSWFQPWCRGGGFFVLGGVVALQGRGVGGMMLGRLIIWDFVGRVWSKIENGSDGLVLQQERKVQKHVKASWCFHVEIKLQ